MAMAPPRPCPDPTCPLLNCTKHLVPAWRTRREPIQVPRLSGRANQRRRAQLFAREPWCRTCAAKGLRVRATIADHVIPLAEGGADDDANLAPTCAACHRTKTQAEAARGARRRR